MLEKVKVASASLPPATGPYPAAAAAARPLHWQCGSGGCRRIGRGGRIPPAPIAATAAQSKVGMLLLVMVVTVAVLQRAAVAVIIVEGQQHRGGVLVEQQGLWAAHAAARGAAAAAATATARPLQPQQGEAAGAGTPRTVQPV